MNLPIRNLRRRALDARKRAEALLYRDNENVDYIQDPHTGLMHGSRPHGGTDAVGNNDGLDPEVINVGGDEWNRQTAIRLEKEYVSVKPKLAALEQAALGQAVTGAFKRPETWADLSNEMQVHVEEKWKSSEYDSAYESEVSAWWESDEPHDLARQKVIYDFNEGNETDWADEILTKLREETDDGEPGWDFPYTNQQLLDAMTLTEAEDVNFDDAKLREPVGASSPEQMTLPGVEPEDLSKRLTTPMREAIANALGGAFPDEVTRVRTYDIEAPDLSEQTQEVVDESWELLDDSQKYDAGVEMGAIEKDEELDADEVKIDALPKKYDPLDETHDSEDYKRTQMLAKYLSIERAAQLMIERGLIKTPGPGYDTIIDAARADVEVMDKRLWESWKEASYSNDGKLLQLAVADELGGRLRTERPNGENYIDKEAIQRKAAEDYLGGYEVVKAYVRAKWEVTQWLLEKANKPVLNLYRAISLRDKNDPNRALDLSKLPPDEAENIGGNVWFKGLRLDRNGAQSTSIDPSVVNEWGSKFGRVVLRIQVPRTAVVSVPAYGINVHKEKEVVVAGTAWKGWDAWVTYAPMFEAEPLRQAA